MSIVEGGGRQVVDLRIFDDETFVVHFGGSLNEVDATTFGNALVALAEAIRGINHEVNPGYTLTVSIDAVGPGSFRARLKTTTRSLKNLFSGVPKSLIVSILAAIIYDKLFDPSQPPNITVSEDFVVVDYGDTRVVVPKEAFDAKQRVAKSLEVNRGIARTMEILEQDPSIESLGLTPGLNDETPVVEIPRALFPVVRTHAQPPEGEQRRFEDVETNLVVIKAVLERSSRKWEFVWNGFRISAPIRDTTFFDRLERRDISLHQGDALEATLRVWKLRDPMTGAWVNESYEVTRVGNVSFRAPGEPRLQ